jgi:predicted transcriptional regulator
MVARVTVTLPEDLLAKLDAIAAGDDVTRSDVVREAAAVYVAQCESGAVARARAAAVTDGVSWLETIAAEEPRDPRPGIEILREIRGEGAVEGAPIQPGPHGGLE